MTSTYVPNTDAGTRKRKEIASALAQWSSSPFDAISRLCSKHQAVNLALGAPDLTTDKAIIEAAVDALRRGLNQYSEASGDRGLREAIAGKIQRHLHVAVDPRNEITVTCGTTEAVLNVALALFSPGDEVILFEPFYTSYIPAIGIGGASIRHVRLHRPDWTFDEAELRAAFNERTKAIIINNPNNPTGKVFTRDELRVIADLCRRWDVFCISDEVYEHMVYDGQEHLSALQFEDLRERAVVLSGLSKTYSLTGWRVAYAIAPQDITNLIRVAHSYSTFCAPTPLQAAAICALNLPDTYYPKFCSDMQARRDRLLSVLERCGFVCFKPAGAFYLMASIDNLASSDDFEFARFLIEEIGVATMPGSSFYAERSAGRDLLRFCYAKSDATLDAAESRLNKLRREED